MLRTDRHRYSDTCPRRRALVLAVARCIRVVLMRRRWS